MRLIDADALKKKATMRENCISPMVTEYRMCVITRDIDDMPTIEAEPVRRGKWRKGKVKGDGYKHRYCTNCKVDALFEYQESPDFDEGIDGEMEYIGMIDYDIIEHITKYCPNCGAKMDLEG